MFFEARGSGLNRIGTRFQLREAEPAGVIGCRGAGQPVSCADSRDPRARNSGSSGIGHLAGYGAGGLTLAEGERRGNQGEEDKLQCHLDSLHRFLSACKL